MKRSQIISHAAVLAVFAIAAAACGSAESSAPSTVGAAQDTATSAAQDTATSAPEPVATQADCPDAGQVAVGLQTGSITSGDVEYDYQWTVPSSYDGSPLPVVLDFHGLGSNGEQQGTFVGWPALAEIEGFIAVQPSGPPLSLSIPHGWEVPQFDIDPEDKDKRDDVAMVVDLLGHLAANVCIDADRIYSTGFSMGAMFTSTLVCELGDVIAAAVTVAGLNHHDECDPIRPVPFLAFHGTADNVTPMNGSKIFPEGSPERQFFEFEQIMPDELGQFADDFGCTDSVDSSVSDSVTLTSYIGCNDDVEIGFYTIEGGGHTWPGSVVFAETPGTGFTTMEIDARSIAWDFFERQSLSS
ncbi:MAG: alpha/beta hydrolase family esterase [Acidimicrobiales bacterium]